MVVENFKVINMKKIVFVLFFFVASFMVGRVAAQPGIAAGFISQQHTFNYRNGMLDSLFQEGVWLRGGYFGVTQTVPLFRKIGITPGLFASYAQLKETISDTLNDFTTSSFMLKMPFIFDYSRVTGPNSKAFVFVGPVFNVALSSLTNFKSVGNQIDFHFDMGGCVGAGIQFYRVRLFMGYNIDLIDRDDFSLADKESVSKAWEGSSFFAGMGVSLGPRHRDM